MADRIPSFLFDVERWFGSIATQRMSFSEKGVYLVMLFQEWRERAKTLPDDADAVADLIALTDEQRTEVFAAWPVVRKKFVTDRRTPDGRMFNIALERTRRTQRAKFRKKTEAARLAGKASAAKRRTEDELDSNERSTDVERPSTDRNSKERRGEVRNITPLTPLAGGKPSREEKKRAREIYKHRFGRCLHEPPCANGEACLVAIVAELRAKKGAA